VAVIPNGTRSKDRKILELYDKGYTYDQITQMVHLSPNTISSVLKRERIGAEQEKRAKQNAQALRLYVQGKSPLDVSIKLAISADEALRLYDEYLRLTDRHQLVRVYEDLGENLPFLIKLYQIMKEAGMPTEGIVQISREYYEIPHATYRLKKLQYDVECERNRKEKYISDWKILNNHNMDLKRRNRELQSENEELQSENEELQSENEELQSENEELGHINAGYKKSLDEVRKNLIHMTLPIGGFKDSTSGNKNLYMMEYPFGNLEFPYLTRGLLSPLPKIVGTSRSMKEENESRPCS
jgi:hypothetical protein